MGLDLSLKPPLHLQNAEARIEKDRENKGIDPLPVRRMATTSWLRSHSSRKTTDAASFPVLASMMSPHLRAVLLSSAWRWGVMKASPPSLGKILPTLEER